MNIETRKTYYEGHCNRLHDLFIHYSTVRMVILSFLIPLGGIMVIDEKRVAGFLVIAVAWLLNFYFGAKSQNMWLIHRNIDLWLFKGDTNINYHDYYEETIPKYCKLVFRILPKEDTFKNPSVPTDWRGKWKKALTDVGRFERIIQTCIFVGIIILAWLLICFS